MIDKDSKGELVTMADELKLLEMDKSELVGMIRGLMQKQPRPITPKEGKVMVDQEELNEAFDTLDQMVCADGEGELFDSIWGFLNKHITQTLANPKAVRGKGKVVVDRWDLQTIFSLCSVEFGFNGAAIQARKIVDNFKEKYLPKEPTNE